jgi:hypothetical protein
MSIDKVTSELKKINQLFTEATDTNGGSGSYRVPLSVGMRLWDKDNLEPFTINVSKYDDAELAYDSYDGEMSYSKDEINKKEKDAVKLAKYMKKHPPLNDDDGDILNNNPTSPSTQVVKEDLAVWFGTKKKPKGSSQPKGPWVNICKKVDGKHPPCGRANATDKAYPKCRAAGVAGKMTDSQKKSACAQKRKAEKSHPKSGTGNKPKMVSYKPKKKESKEQVIERLIKRLLKNL